MSTFPVTQGHHSALTISAEREQKPPVWDRELCTNHKEKTNSKPGWDNLAQSQVFQRDTHISDTSTMPRSEHGLFLWKIPAIRGTSEELEQEAAGSHSLFLLFLFCYCSAHVQMESSFTVTPITAGITQYPALYQTLPRANYISLFTSQSHCSFCKDQQALLTWVSSNVHTEANSPWGNPPGHRRGRGAAVPGWCRSRGPARRCCTSGWAPPTRPHPSPGKPCRGQPGNLPIILLPTSARCYIEYQ